MAKVKNKVPKIIIKAKTSWHENQIQRIRSLAGRLAPRASRLGAFLGIILLLGIIAASSLLPKDRFQEAKEQVLKNPQDSAAHLILAEEFLNNNEIDKAQKELLAAQQYSPAKRDLASPDNLSSQPKVLGVTSKIEELWNRWREQNPQAIEKEIAKWQEFVLKNPTYRDGYLRLALYYQRLKYLEEARVNLAKALDLDPNFPGTKKLQGILGE